MALFAIMLIPQGLWAQTDLNPGVVYEYVRYNSESGKFEKATINAAICKHLTGNTNPNFKDGDVYVVANVDDINSRLVVNGEVSIILCDGKKFSARQGIQVTPGSTLNIYGQSQGTGELVANALKSGTSASSSYYAAIGGSYIKGAPSHTSSTPSNVYIHGGKVTAVTDYENANGIGEAYSYDGGPNTTIYGGTVDVTGGSSANAFYNLTLGPGVTCYSSDGRATRVQSGIITDYFQNMKTVDIIDLKFGDTQVRTTNAFNILNSDMTGGKAATASFDPSSNTLTLNNVTFANKITSGLANLTIELNGTNI